MNIMFCCHEATITEGRALVRLRVGGGGLKGKIGPVIAFSDTGPIRSQLDEEKEPAAALDPDNIQ